MHYAQYKHQDPALVGEILKTFPFAAILVNGVKWPAVAQAPMTFRNGATAAGAVEFHLAIANPIAGDLVRGAHHDSCPWIRNVDLTCLVHGQLSHAQRRPEQDCPHL